ncbi:MAG: tetratricopeptide repeat protein [Desulfobacterales bacterium]|jgi:TolA-binding protein
MKSFLKVILVFVFALTVWSFQFACRGGLDKKIDRIQGALERKIPAENLFVAPDYDKDRPLSVSILPFENLTREKEASDLLRRLFYNNFSSLAYKDIELSTINAKLPNYKPQNIFKSVDPTRVGELLDSDALVIGRITEFESFYAGIYSSFTVAVELKMIDAETRRVLWSVKHKEIQRSGSIPATPIGAIITAASNALDLSRYHIITTINKLCQAAVETIPPSANLKGKSFPKISNLVHNGMNRILKKGERLQVGIEGTAGLKATFRIAPWKTTIDMQEKTPGTYIGSYLVRHKNTISDGVIVVRLSDDWNNVCRWEDTLGFVNIDGVPPDSPTGLQTVAGSQKVLLRWNKSTAADIAGYSIWRSITPLSGYEKIHTTEFTRFEDKDLKNYTSYFYRVIAADRAGNKSQTIVGIPGTPVPPGPTTVQGSLAEDSIWHSGANPYCLKGDVIVPAGSILTINPGVMVKADAKSRLIIRGRLDVSGKKNAPVLFLAADKDRNWGGIIFERSSEKCRLSHFELHGSEIGFRIIESSPELVGGTVKECITGIRIEGSKASPVLDDLTIYRNKTNGVEAVDMAKARITSCRIAYNSDTGIKLIRSPAKVLKNDISYNQNGVLLDQAPALVGGNRIIDNLKNGIVAKNMDFPSLKIDLNYFGNPQDVRIFSSHPGRKTARITILTSKDYQGGRQAVAMSPFPESGSKNEKSLIIATRAEETSATKEAKVKTTEQKSATTQLDTQATATKSALNAFIDGVSAVRKKDYPKAIKLLNIAKKEKSREAETRFWLGFCYLETGRLKKAIFNYHQATKLDPDNSQYLLHLGSALYLSGQPSEAEIIYKEVLHREPDNKDARQFLNLLQEK